MPAFLNSRGFAHIFILIILLLGVVLGVYLVSQTQIFRPKASDEQLKNQEDDVFLSVPKEAEFSSNELLIKVRRESETNIRSQSIRSGEESIKTGIKELDRVFNKYSDIRSVKAVVEDQNDELSLWYKVTLDDSQRFITGSYDEESGFSNDDTPRSLQELARDLDSLDEIVNVEPNYRLYSLRAPYDRYYEGQWWVKKIEMEAAWDVILGAPDVTVAVIDTGFSRDEDPSMIRENIIESPYSWNFVTNTRDVTDYYGHGTSVSGIIGAFTNNSKGIAGVADRTKIMSLVYWDGRAGGTTSIVASAIKHAADNGAKVINMSFGGPHPFEIIRDSVNYAWRKGSVLVAAAGNSGSNGNPIFYPAAYENVVSVAATDQNDVKASFSSFGSWVDIAAPGVDIYSLLAATTRGMHVCTESVGYGYCAKSGTSMSAPIVSGVAALIAQKHPGWTNTQIVQKLLLSTDPISGTGQYWKNGRINACKALDCGAQQISHKQYSCIDGVVSDCGGSYPLHPLSHCENNWQDSMNIEKNNWCGEKTKDEAWGVRNLCFICPAYNLACSVNDECYSDQLVVYNTNQDGNCSSDKTVYRCTIVGDIKNCGENKYRCTKGSSNFWKVVGPRKG